MSFPASELCPHTCFQEKYGSVAKLRITAVNDFQVYRPVDNKNVSQIHLVHTRCTR